MSVTNKLRNKRGQKRPVYRKRSLQKKQKQAYKRDLKVMKTMYMYIYIYIYIENNYIALNYYSSKP